jgi:hypothetical protein
VVRVRVLGTIGMLGSPMMLLQGVLSGFQPLAPSRVNAVLGLLFLAGWTCSAVGLRLLRATGKGFAASAVFAVQLAGLALAALQQVQDFIYAGATPDTLFYAVCDAAWPLSVVFMIVVGIAVLAARVLEGWRRWTPVACGLALPMLIVAGLAFGPRAGILAFAVHTCAAWALLGAAVRTGRSASR